MSVLEIYGTGVVTMLVLPMITTLIHGVDSDGTFELLSIALAVIAAVFWPLVICNIIWEVIKTVYLYSESLWFKYFTTNQYIKRK